MNQKKLKNRITKYILGNDLLTSSKYYILADGSIYEDLRGFSQYIAFVIIDFDEQSQ